MDNLVYENIRTQKVGNCKTFQFFNKTSIMISKPDKLTEKKKMPD